jgi:transitional endoplasmic reticulum ATPase
MMTRNGMKAKYERLYLNSAMYLAKGETELAVKYLNEAALQLKEYIIGLNGEEKEEARELFLQIYTHIKDIQNFKESQAQRQTVSADKKNSFNFEKTKDTYVTFSDVIGLEAVKNQIYDKIIYPKQYKELYERFHKRIGGGILLYGPSGNGKTMIAKAIAHETGSAFYSIKFSDLGSKWFGETEGKIKALFDEARKEESAIIFFDEIDSIASVRGEDLISNRMVAELLTQMDGINRNKGNITVIAATNRIDILDAAVIRPGRFDVKIYVPLPDFQARAQMLKLKLDGAPLDKIDFVRVGKLCEGFSGADVELVCENSKQSVIRAIIGGASNDTKITENDVINAINDIKMQYEKRKSK